MVSGQTHACYVVAAKQPERTSRAFRVDYKAGPVQTGVALDEGTDAQLLQQFIGPKDLNRNNENHITITLVHSGSRRNSLCRL